MNVLVYYLLHVTGALLLAAFTFQAFAAPKPENKKRILMLTGITSMVVLVGGFGLLAKLAYGFPGWVIVKLVCWLGLSGLAGAAFRSPNKTGPLAAIATILIVVAVYAVYFKPF